MVESRSGVPKEVTIADRNTKVQQQFRLISANGVTWELLDTSDGNVYEFWRPDKGRWSAVDRIKQVNRKVGSVVGKIKVHHREQSYLSLFYMAREERPIVGDVLRDDGSGNVMILFHLKYGSECWVSHAKDEVPEPARRTSKNPQLSCVIAA